MEKYIDKLTQYLPKIEEFLTSVLLEQTKVSITKSDTFLPADQLNTLGSEDIYLVCFDKKQKTDIIGILDNEWLALLSGIMLGTDEKTFNEKTEDLLKKFSSEMKTTFKSVLADDGIEVDLDEVIPLQFTNLQDYLHHSEYVHAILEVEGLTDSKVQASVLIGNPATFIEEEEEAETQNDLISEDSQGDGFIKKNGEDLGDIADEVLSGSYIEFEDFDDDASFDFEGEDGKSMDMLRDVNMDVSVELGRIELPLGRVLQLAKGSVIELDKLAGEPVDILVNGQRIAQGEVVVIDDHFGVRISNLITTRQHLVKMN